MRVLVTVRVVRVENALAVGRPEERTDVALLLGSDHLGLRHVGGRSDPDVEDAIDGREPRDLLAVVADEDARVIGFAKNILRGGSDVSARASGAAGAVGAGAGADAMGAGGATGATGGGVSSPPQATTREETSDAIQSQLRAHWPRLTQVRQPRRGSPAQAAGALPIDSALARHVARRSRRAATRDSPADFRTRSSPSARVLRVRVPHAAGRR